MSRLKVTILALFAVVALSALGAASASADWFVNGAKLAARTSLSTTAKVDSFTKLNLPGLKIKVECKGSLLKGKAPLLVPTNSGEAESLEFEKCAVVEEGTAKPCELEGGLANIATKPLIATAALGSGTAVRATFTPKAGAGKEFAFIPFSAENKCALAGEQPVKGAVVVGAPTGQTEELAQAIEGLGSLENNSLEVGAGNKAFLEGGKALLTLASGSKWSFK